MKKLAFLMTMMVTLLFAYQAEAQTKGKKEIKIKTSAQCGMCKERIEEAVDAEKGVKKFNLDVESKVLTVVYNPKKTSPQQIKQAVANVGYDADEVKAHLKAYNSLPACCQKGGHNKNHGK